MPELEQALAEVAAEMAERTDRGDVATYIPQLGKVDPMKFGIAAVTNDGRVILAGDADQPFSIQSVSKVFTLTLALGKVGDALWHRVGREPSGNPFNSIVQLEHENGIPRNPFINAGALVVLDAILDHGDDLLLPFIREAAGDDSIGYDEMVAQAERETGHRNRAMAHFLKSFGNLHNDADRVLDAYFHLCSISMSCLELAASFAFLATGGGSIATPRQAKRVNAVMLTCGVYDEAGDYAYRVGLPAKSGVGGGVVAVMPDRFTAAVWSPGLSEKGNSLAGTMALELLTTKTGMSVF